MIEHFHLVSSIHSEQASYTLCCRCSVGQYDKLATIVCEGTESVECPFSFVRQSGQVVEYQVVVPVLPGARCLFLAVSKDGGKKVVWKPDV